MIDGGSQRRQKRCWLESLQNAAVEDGEVLQLSEVCTGQRHRLSWFRCPHPFILSLILPNLVSKTTFRRTINTTRKKYLKEASIERLALLIYRAFQRLSNLTEWEPISSERLVEQSNNNT